MVVRYLCLNFTMTIIHSSDGSHTLISEKYGVSYHSTFGAITESNHVFIEAGLRWKFKGRNEISILEVGFGTGLNAFLTWLETQQFELTINYVALETDPLDMETVKTLNFPRVLNVPERSEDFWRLHQCPWGQKLAISPRFIFEKRLAPLQELEAEKVFDLIYFDAFDPKVQPEMWESAHFARLNRALKPGGGLVTYCAQGEFRRRLRQSGFTVERLPGALGKWEMTRATTLGTGHE